MDIITPVIKRLPCRPFHKDWHLRYLRFDSTTAGTRCFVMATCQLCGAEWNEEECQIGEADEYGWHKIKLTDRP